jgi:hypothetical protein
MQEGEQAHAQITAPTHTRTHAHTWRNQTCRIKVDACGRVPAADDDVGQAVAVEVTDSDGARVLGRGEFRPREAVRLARVDEHRRVARAAVEEQLQRRAARPARQLQRTHALECPSVGGTHNRDAARHGQRCTHARRDDEVDKAVGVEVDGNELVLPGHRRQRVAADVPAPDRGHGADAVHRQRFSKAICMRCASRTSTSAVALWSRREHR